MKKYFVGFSTMLVIFANSPQVLADEIEIFGEEFDNKNNSPVETQNTPQVVEVQETPQPAEVQETPQPAEVQNTPPPAEVQNTPPPAEVQNTPQPAEVQNTPQPAEVQNTPQPAEVQETPQPAEVQNTPQPAEVQETPQPAEVQKPFAENPPIENTPPTEVFTPTATNTNNAEDEEDFGDSLNFDNMNGQSAPVENLTPRNTGRNTADNTTVNIPSANNSSNSSSGQTESAPTAKQPKLKALPQRFVQVAVDENYIYYLDKQSVSWKKIPYLTSEYMADVWVRMIERNPNTSDMPEDLANYVNDTNTDEITLARAKGYQYTAEDIKVLRHKKYFLEHYYLRPKKEQIQFLSELEVVGHPQNTASQRKYDPNNWEELIPGSMESILYYSIIQVIGKSKADEKGHMTFFDMVEEYARISIR